MRLIADTHAHTIASGHAYSSLKEMAYAASKNGLEVLSLTEHAPQMPGSCQEIYFRNFNVIPREMHGVKLLLGTELNIMNPDGDLDLSESLCRNLDIVIASIHSPCYGLDHTREENTKAYTAVMKKPYVDIIGHPDDGRYEIDYEALIQGAKEYGKVLELNNHSMDPDCNRQNAVENDTVMLNLCKKYQVPVVMDSDAHFDLLIGEFDRARDLLEKLDFPEELVLNRSVDAIRKYVNRKF